MIALDLARSPRSAALAAAVLGICLAAMMATVSCEPAGDHRTGPDDGPPRLVVVVVVDQLSFPRLERLRSLLSDGLAEILDRGVSFVDAHHHHACTDTAAGHASIATGLHPSEHGIVGNKWYERGGRRVVRSVVGDDGVLSPIRLLAPGLGDWLKESSGSSKVFSVSVKDRAAILLGGHRADGAFWYNPQEGVFETSRYYARRPPRWLRRFNAASPPPEPVWTPLPVPVHQLRGLGLASWRFDLLEDEFSHRLSDTAASPAETAFHRSPFVDVELGRLARELVSENDLGADREVDLLWISFSSPDMISHDFGPDSREYLDALLRLDRRIGELLEFLDDEIGLERVVMALTADHGSGPVPEQGRLGGYPGRRIGPAESECLEGATRVLEGRVDRVTRVGNGIYLDCLVSQPAERKAVESEYASAVESCPAVESVWTRSELQDGKTPDVPFEELYRNAFHPERSPDLLIQFREYFTATEKVLADHGSPYAYDTHVPMVFVGGGAGSRRLPDRVDPVDLAPTLAGWIGIPAPIGVHGIDRSGQVRDP
jgi:predicted AlkP superfamily pyrophosphatase or phosphodiesterase